MKSAMTIQSGMGMLLMGCSMIGRAGAATPTAAYEVSLVQPEQKAWVSGYWGYNAPKLVYDGKHYYSVGLTGVEEAKSQGVLYELEGGEWIKGFECPINYQPPLLLLDSQKRLIFIHSVMNSRPVILRAQGPGDFRNLQPIEVSSEIKAAGYIGAAIHKDLLILGYIGKRVYDFCVITCDLKTGNWSSERMLAPEQRKTIPYTTWMYPCIWPDVGGFHLLVVNASGYKNLYDRVHYLFLPYDLQAGAIRPELVQSIDTIEDRLAFSMALWKDASDGAMVAAVLYSPTTRSQIIQVWRRDTRTGQWSKSEPGEGYIAGLYQVPGEPNTIWLPVTHGDGLLLYRSIDKCRTWLPVQLPDFGAAGVTGVAGFLYVLNPTSGSVLEGGPAAVFSTSGPRGYAHWFVKFHLPD
jgi:hypothetical protein